MTRIAIIGGHGKIALLAAHKLAAAGHEVSSIIRNPDHAADVAEAGAAPVVADVEQLDTDELAELLTGHQVIVWSAGAGGGHPERTYAVDRDAAIRSMDASRQAGVLRYVMVSYFGAGPDHGVPEDNSFFTYAEAKAAADEHLKASELQWTILKPSTLTLDPSSGTLDPANDGKTSTSRELVADVITAVVEADPETVAGREIEFTDGDVPIADALHRS